MSDVSPPAGARWQRSSNCVGEGHCVEVAYGEEVVYLRNSTRPDRWLRLDRDDWRRLLTMLRSADTTP